MKLCHRNRTARARRKPFPSFSPQTLRIPKCPHFSSSPKAVKKTHTLSKQSPKTRQKNNASCSSMRRKRAREQRDGTQTSQQLEKRRKGREKRICKHGLSFQKETSRAENVPQTGCCSRAKKEEGLRNDLVRNTFLRTYITRNFCTRIHHKKKLSAFSSLFRAILPANEQKIEKRCCQNAQRKKSTC
jgi:hypothetical protein